MYDSGMIIAKYLRISQDDERNEESQSIANQRILIADYIANRPDLNSKKTMEFVDDGYTGMNFNRPGAVQMLDLVKRGEVDCIIVKDFSRFSRDYIEAGDYLEQIFPFLGIRFISINDNYDSAVHGSLAGDVGNGFKNLYNTYYCKDISRKTRSGMLAKKQSGTYTPAQCPYGYKKASGSSAGIGMILDEMAAPIVKRIYAMRIEGKTMPQIAGVLNAENSPSPMAQQRINGSSLRNGSKSNNLLWSQSSILNVLSDIRYTGCFAYGMHMNERIGDKTSKKIPMSEWTLVPDAIPAIITIEEYEKVQALKLKRKPKPCKTKNTHAYYEILAFTNSTGNSNINTNSIDSAKVTRENQCKVKAINDRKTALYEKYCDGKLTRDEYIAKRDAEDKLIIALNPE